MSTAALAVSNRQIVDLRRPLPLLAVLAWELRRFRASRLFWFQALGFWGFQLLIIWALRDQGGLMTVGHQQFTFHVAVTSAQGLLGTLPTYVMALVFVLPFVTADGVTRDQQRQTHELVLTTALPTWAYVWGRYLAVLLMGLGLALLLFVSFLGMGGVLHLTDAPYSLPHPAAVFLLWVGMVVSATILVSSVGFALSTVWPGLSILIKTSIMVVWLMGAVIIPNGLIDQPPTWYVDWDPTSAFTAQGMLPAYGIPPHTTFTSQAQVQQLVLSLQNTMPNLAGWFVPHLVLAGLSLVLVLIAALTFKHSRNVLA
jgi:ABC-type transport system involved in multi-copper enzyme maturation permease subunit